MAMKPNTSALPPFVVIVGAEPPAHLIVLNQVIPFPPSLSCSILITNFCPLVTLAK